MKGFIDSIHLFKRQPDIVVPLLQRFLQFSDDKVLEQLHAFYVPLLEDLYDSSFVDELDRSGYIQRLYSEKTKLE